MDSVRINFPGIHPSAWEHPADRLALNALRKVPGLDKVVQGLIGTTQEKSLYLMHLADGVRVSERQFARVHALTVEACRILDAKRVPDVFVVQNPMYNASAIGAMNPFIVLHSSLVGSMTDEELMGIIGHEMGHILSGHVQYKTMLYLIMQFGFRIFSIIPFSGIALLGLIAALYEWDRKSELSADRAELLVTQNLDVSIRAHMKLAGGNFVNEINQEEFLKQAEEYEKANSVLDSVHKFANLIWRTHPNTVVRVAELKKWVDSGAYQQILNGQYATEATAPSEDAKETANGYKQDFKSTTEPFESAIKDVGKGVEEVFDKASDFFNDLFKKK